MEGWRSLVALLLISVFAFVSVLAEEVLFLIIQHLLWVQELHLQHFRHLRWMKRRRRFPRRVSHQPRNSRFHINQVSHWVSHQVSYEPRKPSFIISFKRTYFHIKFHTNQEIQGFRPSKFHINQVSHQVSHQPSWKCWIIKVIQSKTMTPKVAILNKLPKLKLYSSLS